MRNGETGRPLFPEGEQYDAIKARDGLEKLCEDETAAVNGAPQPGIQPAGACSLLSGN